ncbi:MAG: acyl CoA:acetate/3-ketoacid CoA transferase [Peptoanaerobacter stomatis]
MSVKFMTAREAADLIYDGATVGTGGFVGFGIPEEIELELGNRYNETKSPKAITLYYAAAQGDGKDRAVNHFDAEGLLKRVVGGHWNLAPKLQKLVFDNKMEAYNFPQGILSHMFRDAASGKPATISKVGLKTFVDPDLQGGKLNDVTKEDLVKKVNIEGEEYMYYYTPKLDFVILRGTFADELGNISLEEEYASLDATNMAVACKNNGGTVIVQVKDIVNANSLDPRLVKIPGALVDVVVKTTDPFKYHEQAFGAYFDPTYCGMAKKLLSTVEPPVLDNRKVIGRRGALEMKANSVINLGIGIPELVGAVTNEEGEGEKMTLSVEAGITGGVPLGGLQFGGAINPYCIVDQDTQFCFYDGGGLDATFLGLAQCDEKGNINVSKFGPRIAGCGGFINISQNTKKVIFCGTFTAGGLKEEVKDGKLIILQEGREKKFIKNVEQITFSADYANETNQDVTYITERCVLKLTKEGLMITEIAPGVDMDKDILAHMEFKPLISKDLKLMDERIFKDELMGLKLQ